MPPQLISGQLVEILPDKGAPEGLEGQQGQVTEWDEDASAWTVATFSASLVSVKEACLRPLATADVEGKFDVAIGPASDPGILASELVDHLSRDGHVLCRLFVAPTDLAQMVSTAERCVEEGMFTRLAPELEPGYLGRDGAGKVMALDLEESTLPEFIKDSPFRIAEESVSAVGQLVDQLAHEEFGWSVYSRSSTMLMMPFSGDEDSYEIPDLENEEAAQFLSMMWRAKVQVLVNAGPSPATLTLTPKLAGEKEGKEITLEPGMLAMFAVDRYRFACTPKGKALLMSCWFLDVPREYVLSDLEGDLSTLISGAVGPAAPETEDPVCIVALGTRYAFGIDEPWKLWVAYAKAGWDDFIRHPFARWDYSFYYADDAEPGSGLSYTCHGGFSDGIELFDCRFFDIAPAEAKGMDPTQRQVLETMYISLVQGGWTKKDLGAKPANICGFVGLDKNEWITMPKDQQAGFGACSGSNAITSNRFNYCMNLKGASMTIDTACSASLVCTHTGKLYLLFKHYDPPVATIVCGVNLLLSPGSFIGCCGAGMLSHVGRCFTYNQSADGYARGESTASQMMKPKKYDALEVKGDYCMLAGTQCNQDGRSASLTAPNGPSQERCMRAVLKEALCTSMEVDTTECHGTGTSLGDPIEIGAYRKVMTNEPREVPCFITCTKSNIGHCEGSAGIGGLIKIIFMSGFAEATPNMHFNCYNPHLDLEGFPGLFMTENAVLRSDATRNGVLSFGFGGTNACAQCYGRNIMTSRGSLNGDIYSKLLSKVKAAPYPEVTVAGESWEEWEMEGPGKDAKPNDLWEVEVDDEGAVTWSQKDKDDPDLGSEYFLTGSFNKWDYEPMEADNMLPGIFFTVLELDNSGKVEFQVVADEDMAFTFYPEHKYCRQKSAQVCGPSSSPSRDYVWSIHGVPGDVYRVEFYRAEAGTVSITWIKEKSGGGFVEGDEGAET